MEPEKRPRPSPSHTSGNAKADSLGIYVPDSVLQGILKYCAEGTPNSVGGVLVGRWCQENQSEFIDIEGYIKAVAGTSGRNTFTFTKKSWIQTMNSMSEWWPESKMLGWFFSQSGTGIFLSRQNIDLHANFFSNPWMVVLIVDPEQESLGFFQWKNKDIVPSGFHLTGL